MNEVLSILESLSLEEKKEGYANILHMFTVELRARLLREDDIVAIANAVHELPPFLVRDMERFSDSIFWNGAQRSKVVFDKLAMWFVMGVKAHQLKMEMLKK